VKQNIAALFMVDEGRREVGLLQRQRDRQTDRQTDRETDIFNAP